MAKTPQELDGEMLSVPEVHHLLEKERAERGELSYEQKLSLDHAKAFDRLGSEETALALRAELEALDRVTPAQAVKIVNLCPTDPEELKAVFAKDRQELTQEDSDTIISIVENHL